MWPNVMPFLKQGIWASFTGGWFYDQRQSHFANVFHLYIWLVLYCFPLSLHLFDPLSIGAQGLTMVYCSGIAVLFVTIKVVNERLHRLFESGRFELHVRPNSIAVKSSSRSSKANRLINESHRFRVTDGNTDRSNNPNDYVGIELLELNGPGHETTSLIPLADSMTADSTERSVQTIACHVDIHHRHSSNASLNECGRSIMTRTSQHTNQEGPNSCGRSEIIYNDLTSNAGDADELKSVGEADSIAPVQFSATTELIRNEKEAEIVIRQPEDDDDAEEEGSIITFHLPVEESKADDSQSVQSALVLTAKEVFGEQMSFCAAQDPSVLRNKRCGSDEQCANLRFAGRRVKSELQTSVETSSSKSNHHRNQHHHHNQVPSHPVSLEHLMRQTDLNSIKHSLNNVPESGGAKKSTDEISNKSKIKQITNPASLNKLSIPSISGSSISSSLTPSTSSSSASSTSTSGSTSTSSSSESSALLSSNHQHTAARTLLKAKNDRHMLRRKRCFDRQRYARIRGSQLNRNSKFSCSQKLDSNSRKRRQIGTRLSNLRFHSSSLTSTKTDLVNSDTTKSESTALATLPLASPADIGSSMMMPDTLEATSALSNPVASGSSTSEGPPAYLLAQILSTPGTHLAKSHDDTNIGAVHCFQDERGNWLTYIFDEHSSGIARDLMDKNKRQLTVNTIKEIESTRPNTRLSARSSFSSIDPTVNADHTTGSHTHSSYASALAASGASGTSAVDPTVIRCLTQSSNSLFDAPLPIVTSRGPNMMLHEPITASLSSALHGSSTLSDRCNALDFELDLDSKKVKQYVELPLIPFFRSCNLFTVHINRLNLLMLLDRSHSMFELLASILLAVLVSLLAARMIERQMYQGIALLCFCFVVASCQYTLLKSVQPDAASSTHGFNRTIIFSRPFYFLVFGLFALACNYYTQHQLDWQFHVYNHNIFDSNFIQFLERQTALLILLFPIIFSIGLLPQVSTFLMYLLEQVDMHMFGASAATTGLMSAMYSFTRSIAFFLILYVFAVASLSESLHNIAPNEVTPTHLNAMFSVFCGFLVFFSYHLSRTSSDPTVMRQLICRWIAEKRWSCRLWHHRRHQRRQEQSDLECNATDECEVQQMNRDEYEYRLDDDEHDEATFDEDEDNMSEFEDPLPAQLESTILLRFENDLLCGFFIVILVFAVHVSTIFTVQPYVDMCVKTFAIGVGILLHYIIPHLRKELPWLCCASPLLKSSEYDLYEVKGESRLMWFERMHALLFLFEKNVIYPLVFLNSITIDTPLFIRQFGFSLGIGLMVICAVKCFRSAFNDCRSMYATLLFAQLLFKFDLIGYREPFLLNFAILRLAHSRLDELILKMQFATTYLAPWQFSWGSAFHAFAQPFSAPHSGLLFFQMIVAALISAPLQPFLGSVIFIISYVRPIRFWEKEYNTRRLDSGNSRLQAQLESGGSDDDNLNSVFYEHLSRRLQSKLCGDVALGRWGNVEQGDCFVLASDKLNALLHVVALGNGVLTFQLRGLEFRGTYCQQREVEAINEWVNQDTGCCCYKPGHLPGLLSLNAAFNQRWLSWQVVRSKYVFEAYSISDYAAMPMVHQYDMRKALLSYYVRCVCYYAVGSHRLNRWLRDARIRSHLIQNAGLTAVDLDAAFSSTVHEDYDLRAGGISRRVFASVYGKWITHCLRNRHHRSSALNDQVLSSAPATSIGSASLGSASIGAMSCDRYAASTTTNGTANASTSVAALSSEPDELLVSLCFALSLVARRSLNAASNCSAAGSVEQLLHGIHALFKGDFRLGAPRDEWVFADMHLLHKVIAPAVRMAFKLHQEHFRSTEDYEDDHCLFLAIRNYERTLVIKHEADPKWRSAILKNVNSLLTIRHVFDDGSDVYKVIMLDKRHVSFRLIKVNRECVRGLWAGQQQELVYLRNSNAERGSIQNARHSLRNIINSSCDQPIGYPNYVSPLLSSFAETNSQWLKATGSPLTFRWIVRSIRSIFARLRRRCEQACTSRTFHVHPSIPMERVCTTGNNSNSATGTLGAPNVASNGSRLNIQSSLASRRSRSTITVPSTEVKCNVSGDFESTTVAIKRNRSASSGHHVQLNKQVRRADNCESLDQPSLLTSTATIARPPETSVTSAASIGDCASISKSKVDQV